MKANLIVVMILGIFLVSGGTAVSADILQKKDINNATLENLTSVKGIGEKKASVILGYLQEHGPVKEMNELLKIKGIGEKMLEKIKEEFEIKDKSATP
ncbi:MAG: helix-hairpin-helix domain-containing protein [Nitrospirota bacterium]|nr:helix-hairpin-helix domain-containing protein [Nitrospirota bacterium]